MSVLAKLNKKFENAESALGIPVVGSFREFLAKHGRVKTGAGYVPYTFDGREGLSVAVDIIDYILGNPIDTDVELPHLPGIPVHELRRHRAPIKDAVLAVCGGAQIGKTILELWLKVYLMSLKWLNVGLYLPDDDLVQGVVDAKLRPDVIDQLPWFAKLIRVGKTLNESGKAADRKGAFIVTDGKRNALGMMRGMAKFPTTFSMDAQIVDERDDIPEAKAKFLPGRMTASDLRFQFKIGTQRVHGAGQNKEFTEGTQNTGLLTCRCCSLKQNPDVEWPAICRVAMDGVPSPEDPALTYEGDFKHEGKGETIALFDPQALYYYACIDCGTALDRRDVVFPPQQAEKMKINHFSVRVAQLTSSAIDIVQIVADWCLNAVRDPDAMAAFMCDRAGIPKNHHQGITPAIISRARSFDPPALSIAPRVAVPRFAGLDTGDRCWFTVRDINTPLDKNVSWLEQMSAEKVRARVPQLFQLMGLSALFVDAGPLRDLARDLCFLLNGLVNFDFPKLPDPEKAYINFGNGLVWDGPNGKWRGIKCAAVEFSLKDGKGVRQQLGITQDGKMYPLIQCNRDESIQHTVNDFLTAEEGVIEVVEFQGQRHARTEPTLRVPERKAGSPKILETLDSHLLVGSQKVEGKDGQLHFVDSCENHFLLSLVYGDLAERICEGMRPAPFAYESINTQDVDGGEVWL